MFRTAEIAILIGLQSVNNEQWGSTYFPTDTVQKITYPIAFSSIYVVVLSISSTDDARGGYAWTAIYKNKTGFTATSQGDMSLLSGDWVALGK